MSASKPSPEHKSFMERQYIRLNQRQGLALFNELLQKNDINSKFNLSILLVFLLSTVVHLMAVILFALGAYVLITGYRHVVMIAVALLFFGVAWLARPRFARLPRYPIDRRASPMLYQVVDTLAENIGTHIDMIEFTGEFNASTYLASWRQARVLSIGLPLWVILTNEK